MGKLYPIIDKLILGWYHKGVTKTTKKMKNKYKYIYVYHEGIAFIAIPFIFL